MTDEQAGPKFVQYFVPVLRALRTLGGSARAAEVRSQVADDLSVSEEEQAEMLPSGAQPRFDNQVHWARFYLAKAGYIDAPRRGVWSLTEKARDLEDPGASWALTLFKAVHTRLSSPANNSASQERKPPIEDDDLAPTDGETTVASGYRDRLIETLRALPPSVPDILFNAPVQVQNRGKHYEEPYRHPRHVDHSHFRNAPSGLVG